VVVVFAGGLQRLAALFVVDGEAEVETAQQLDEPLVDQRVAR
jgi:hypothetical protein